MIAILLLGHGTFGSSMLHSCQMICGMPQNAAAVDFLPDYDVDALEGKIDEALAKVDYSSGILALCDLTGGTPFNRIMLKAAEDSDLNIHVVGGVNLAMVIEAAAMHDYESNIDKIVDHIMKISKESVVYGNKILDM